MTTHGPDDTANDIEAIAIIGMDGRFPGADSVDEYWQNLLAGRETIERLDAKMLDPSVPREWLARPDYVPARGILRDADCFDAAFFDIPPREAEVTDPQQRVFLEMCWRALEHSGYAPGTHRALCGVFAGMSYNTYFNAHVAKHPEILAGYGDIPALVANEKDYLATRVGYKLDLRGPCINVSTACSTSLVAICHAYNSLLDYQCDIALAGGISVLCPQERGYVYQEGSIYSPDGHCRPFDADARGTVFGNGGGVVVLKRLSEAVADGDTIHAVIRGAAMNNDGAGKVSFTAPGVEGQSEVIQMAQELAGVRADDIGYVEAHGTGTTLGDPIEIAALTRAFRRHTDDCGFCGIGSVKGNIGHLDAASGVAGLIKTVLALREGRIPGTMHFSRPNPALALEETPFRVIDTACEWQPRQGTPRRAAVSSFGLGGTNAHVVLEEAPAAEASSPARDCELLVLSAKTDAALDRARAALARQLREHEEKNFSDIAFTLQQGRQAFAHRLAVAARDHAEAADILGGKAGGRLRRGLAGSEPPRVVFLFPGQGSQYAGMCARLYEAEPQVRDIIDRCAVALHGVLEFDLRDVMFDRIDNASELLDETAYTQPALFAAEYALARLWMQWGIEPAALIGHSIGEFVAATLADVFSPEDAVRAVAERARLMQACDTGSMLSVRLSEAALRERLDPDIELAAVNAPELCVVSGSDAAIQRFCKRLEADDIVCRVLRTSHAFHSAMMEPAANAFRDFMQGVPLHAPARTVISTLTGREMTADIATDPEYWSRQLREPVRFLDALRAARSDADDAVFLEAGPGIAGATFASQAFADDARVKITGSLGRQAGKDPELSSLLDAAGQLWTHGLPLDWQAMRGDERRRRVPLPAYAFERTRHWLDSRGESAVAASPVKPADTGSSATQEPLAERIARLLADISGVAVDDEQYETRFTDMALDSLFLTQFGQALKARFGVELRFREMLAEYNTVAAIAALIEKQNPPAPASQPAAAESSPQATAATLPAARQPDNDVRALTGSARTYARDLARRYTWRTSGSKAFARTHRGHLADTGSGIDPACREMAYPIVIQSASGSHFQDIDGNAWIDLANGGGSGLLGHSAPAVTDAVRQQLRRGYDAALLTPLAGRVARQLQALTGCERAAFCTTEADALRAGLCVARQITGRNRIAMFGGDRHGLGDAHADDLVYGSDAAIREINDHGNTLAAIVVEPVPLLNPERHSIAFLRSLRDAATACGAVLIFDETTTGFRAHPGGIQGMSGIRADLSIFGRACGGGLPLGVLAGGARFLDAIDGGDFASADAVPPGLLTREPLALAAAEAVLGHLLQSGPGLQESLNARTAQFVAALERIADETGAPVRFRRFASWFLVDVDDRVPGAELLYCRLRAGGVHVREGQPCFLGTAHSDADLAEVRGVFRDAVTEMRAAGFFDGIETGTPPAPEPEAVTPGAFDPGMPPVPDARLGRRPDGQPGWFVPDPERPGRYRELRSTGSAPTHELRA